MARQKELSKYPAEYYSIFRMANEREVIIACDSEKQAHNLRNDLYAFRSALYKHGTERDQRLAQNVRMFIQGDHLVAEAIRMPAQLMGQSPIAKEQKNGTETKP